MTQRPSFPQATETTKNSIKGLNTPMSRRGILKLGGLSVAAVTGSSVLAGCTPGSASGSGGGKEITVMISQSPTAPEGQKRILDLMRRKFEAAHPGNTVKFDVVQLGSAVSSAVVNTAATKEGPDIFEIGPNGLPTGAATGVFTPISDSEWSDLGGKDRYLPSMLAVTGKDNTDHVAIPYYASTMAMYYNKRMFADAGIATAPTTWNDFVETGQRLSDASQGRFGVGEAGAEPSHAWHVIWLLTTQLGGRLISADGRTAQLNTPEVMQGVGFWLDWIAKYKIVNPKDATNSSAQQIQQFVQKQNAMFPCGFTQAISSMPGSPVENEWALAGNPTVPYGQNQLQGGAQPVQSYLGGATWAISKFSKNRDLALGLAKIMGEPDVQQLTWKEVGGLPTTNETFTAHPETREGDWKVIYEAAAGAQATPWSPSFGQVSPLLAAAVKPSFSELAATGTYSVDQLKVQLDTANEKLKAALNSEKH
jgi:multiple sugar transport system substrate-binding protein